MGLVRVLGPFQTGFGRFDQELWLKPVQNWLRNVRYGRLKGSRPGQVLARTYANSLRF